MAEGLESAAVPQPDDHADDEGQGQLPEQHQEDQTSGREAAKRDPPITKTAAAPADETELAQPPDPVPLENVIDAAADVTPPSHSNEADAGDTGSDGDDEIVTERLKIFAAGKDFYCWHCHKERGNLSCSACPRSYHRKCLPANYLFEGQASAKKTAMSAELAACPECKLIQEGEERRRTSLSSVSDEELNQLLISALGTIKSNAETQFYFPVSDTDFPEYKKFILHPMDFAAIDRNVRRGVYKSTDGFTADVKWIVHNCYIYNSPNHILTKNANYFFKVTKTEMGELEVCPDCFRNYYQFNKTYFVETCKSPHRLVWARLKGHPFWPAKLVRIDAAKREGDCRFFGAHDRAWVPFESIFLLSEQYPWTKSKTHKNKLDAALCEARAHIEKLSLHFPGVFRYADPKTQFKFANACLTSDELMSESSSGATGAGVRVTESPVAQSQQQQLSGLKRTGKQKSEIITQNKDDDGMLLDDEERPLIIDAPIDETASPGNTKSSPAYSASGFKRKSSDSSKNKAISDSVKRSSAGPSNPGNGSTTTTSAADVASKKALLGQKSKIPTKKAISSATASAKAPASSSSSPSGKSGRSATQTNCPATARAAGKRKESPSSSAPTTHEGPADATGKKARIVNTGYKSGESVAGGSRMTPAAKKTKLAAAARNEKSLLSHTKDKHAAAAGVSGVNSNRNSSRTVTHAANGSLPSATAPSSITIQINSDPAEFPSSQQSPSSSPDSSLPGSIARSNSNAAAANSHSSAEVKQLKDEIKRLKDQVSKLTTEMKDMKDLTETRIAKVSQDKEKAIIDQESRLSKSFASQLEETKRKQWCAHCLKEAIYFCCWNTAFCSHTCQGKNWPSHMASCQQYSKTQSASGSAAAPNPAATKQEQQATVESVKTEDK